MNRNEAINVLQSYADAIKARGATSLYLFGSSARDSAGADSDLDLFVDYDAGKFSLVDLVDIKLYLEDRLGIAVDVTTRDSLHPMLRSGIETSAIRVF
jgi:predicted nucleotidyltransferase